MFSGRTWQTLHLLGIPYLLSLILLGGSARAQDSSTGALRGTVTDAQGAAVSSADVLAVRVETGIRYHVLTDVQGGFTVDLLPPGEYIARAEAAGMLPQDSPRVRVEVGAATELTFKLAVAGAKETLTVSGAPPLVETQPSSISALVDERAIADLPLQWAAFYRSVVAGAGRDDRSARSDFGFERRSGVWRNSRLPVELSGGWRRQQQRILRAGSGTLSRSVSVFE